MISCDYCGTISKKETFWCSACCRHMCALCYSEKSWEIASNNGSKKEMYLKRKPLLERCFYHSEHLDLFWKSYVDPSTLEIVHVEKEWEDGCILTDGSKYYMATHDNHGRTGIFSVNERLESLKKMIESVSDDYTKLSGWSKFYNSPFKQVMRYNFDMITHYGEDDLVIDEIKTIHLKISYLLETISKSNVILKDSDSDE